MTRIQNLTEAEIRAFDLAVTTHLLETIKEDMMCYFDDSGDYYFGATELLGRHAKYLFMNEGRFKQDYEDLIAVTINCSATTPGVYYDYAVQYLGYDLNTLTFLPTSRYNPEMLHRLDLTL